jgi:uncharacterized C2H2 Zn-finger protein
MICSFPKNIEDKVSETHEQIENCQKNDQKKGENFLDKINELSNEVKVSEIVEYGTTKLSIGEQFSEIVYSNCDNLEVTSNEFITINGEIRFKCEQCGKSYNAKKNLWRHKNDTICGVLIKKKENDKNNEICELKKKMEEMSKKLTLVENTNNKLINELAHTNNNNTHNNNTHSNNTQTNSNNLTQTNSNNLNTLTNNNNLNNSNNKTIVFNYVNQEYQNAPPMKMLRINEVCELLKMKHPKYTIADFIIFHYKKYELPAFLGDIIVNAYKKEDPEEQQIWISSVMHLTFIVRQILNKKPQWGKDMNGVVIIKNIINPILKKVLSLLQDYTQLVKEKSKDTVTQMYEMEEMENNGIVAVNIIRDINNKTLHKQILKHIAPEFQLNCEAELSKIVMKEKKPTKRVIKNK